MSSLGWLLELTGVCNFHYLLPDMIGHQLRCFGTIFRLSSSKFKNEANEFACYLRWRFKYGDWVFPYRQI